MCLEIKILGYLRNNFIEVADFHNQSKDKIVEITVSSSCSHVCVIWSSPQPAETKLSVYMLPVDSWMSELHVATPAGSQVSITSQKVSEIHHKEYYNSTLLLFGRMWCTLSLFSSTPYLHLPLLLHPLLVTLMPSIRGTGQVPGLQI